MNNHTKAIMLVTCIAAAMCMAVDGAAVAPVQDAKPLKYSPMIFGHFIEHFDTQVYGGLF